MSARERWRGARRPHESPDAEPEQRGSADPYLRLERFNDLRELLEDDLGAPVSDRAWRHLCRIWPEGLRRIRQDPQRWLPLLRQKYEIAREDLGVGRSQRRITSRVEDADAREEALARLLAARLARRPELSPTTQEFRERVLGGELIEPRAVPDWILAQAQREGAPSQAVPYLPVPVLDGGSAAWRELLFTPLRRESFAAWLRDLAEVVERCPENELRLPDLRASEYVAELSYAAPGGAVRSRPIRAGGELAALKEAASGTLGLAALTGWREHEAVAFVLSGWAPRQPRLALGARPYGGLLLDRGRLNIELDARVPPRELAAAYAQLRTGYAVGADRAMLPRNLELAVFTEVTLDEGSTWPQRRARWNELHVKWRFAVERDPEARRFALESRRAWQRLTGEEWPHSRTGQRR